MTDYLYNLPNNTTSLDGMINQMTQGSFYWFVPMILFFVFTVVFMGGITRQKNKTGRADYSGWAIIGAMATLLPALIFSISLGFIRLDWLVIVITLNIGCAIWFFFDRKSSEI